MRKRKTKVKMMSALYKVGKVRCNKKGHRLSYSQKHDAYYCKICNKWLEKRCSSEPQSCELCNGRPRRPLEK